MEKLSEERRKELVASIVADVTKRIDLAMGSEEMRQEQAALRPEIFNCPGDFTCASSYTCSSSFQTLL
jgi:hypothetical protein